MKVQQSDILKFNELYYQTHNASEVARQTSFSAGTVRKYLINGYVPQDKLEIKKFTSDMIPTEIDPEIFNIENWGELCHLSKDEMNEMREFTKELAI